MLVKHGHRIVEASDKVGRGRLELGQEEVAVFPVGLHLHQGLFNVEFLVGPLAHLLAELDVRKHPGLDYVREVEPLLGSDVEAHLVRDLVPVALLHALLAQGHRERHVGLEVINGALHSLRDLSDLGELLVFEETEHT